MKKKNNSSNTEKKEKKIVMNRNGKWKQLNELHHALNGCKREKKQNWSQSIKKSRKMMFITRICQVFSIYRKISRTLVFKCMHLNWYWVQLNVPSIFIDLWMNSIHLFKQKDWNVCIKMFFEVYFVFFYLPFHSANEHIHSVFWSHLQILWHLKCIDES